MQASEARSLVPYPSASTAPVGARPILVVDDDPVITRSLARALRRRGFDVVITNTSFGVLNLIAEHQPGLVVLDVTMPSIDGPGITELVRNDPHLADTRIVLHSAMDHQALASTAAACRADAYWSKTGPWEHTIDAIAAAAARDDQAPLSAPGV